MNEPLMLEKLNSIKKEVSDLIIMIGKGELDSPTLPERTKDALGVGRE